MYLFFSSFSIDPIKSLAKCSTWVIIVQEITLENGSPSTFLFQDQNIRWFLRNSIILNTSRSTPTSVISQTNSSISKSFYLLFIFNVFLRFGTFYDFFLANIFRLDTLKKSFYPFINIFLFLHNHTVYFTLLSAPFQSNFHFPNFYSLLCHPFQHYFLLSYMCVSYELFPWKLL